MKSKWFKWYEKIIILSIMTGLLWCIGYLLLAAMNSWNIFDG